MTFYNTHYYKVEILDLSNNRLEYITLSRLKQLKEFYMHNNKMQRLFHLI